MKQLTLLIKPASSACNMRCRYCFYVDEARHRETGNRGIMTKETRDCLIARAIEAVEEKGTIQFSFQGGEPTVAGLEFFQDFVDTVGRMDQGKHEIYYALQTNGFLINAKWVSFLREHRFLTGISIDGCESLHDLYRLGPQNEGTFRKIRRKVYLLSESGVECNLLCVITRQAAAMAKPIYTGLKLLGVPYLQMIPCLDPLDAQGSAPWSLDSTSYARFLMELFDLWYEDWKKGQYTSVRMFEDLVQMKMGLLPSACAACGACGSYLVVEADGSVYPCDFYCLDDFCLGRIQDMSMQALFHSDRMRAFQMKDGLQMDEACAECRFYDLCRGGCRREWVVREGRAVHSRCGELRTFFAYAYDRVSEIAEAEIQARTRLGK
ncbi:MAG: anaerobic sulfatase maturase [Clostridia bacterium]|nr:anaerobic sulfatase maturase [Clostridia bacterium]